MNIGDTVLVCQRKENKLAPKYNPQPYKVTARKGVTVCRNGHYITRNVVYFKKIPGHNKYFMDIYYDYDGDLDLDYDGNDYDGNIQRQEEELQILPQRYPVRVICPIDRYGSNMFQT